MRFTEIAVNELKLNPMTMIGGEWMLITAGNEQNGCNTMTAAWGHLGVVWERKDGSGRRVPPLSTAVVYVRPSRYTKEFMDREDRYTLSVLDKGHRKALGYLGSHSGRDGDKIAAAGITPVFVDGTVYFEEAKMVLICKKIYHAPLIEDGFVDKSLIAGNYPEKDFHEMYIGEILKVLIRE